jgi:hypothetical protein
MIITYTQYLRQLTSVMYTSDYDLGKIIDMNSIRPLLSIVYHAIDPLAQ